MTSLLGRMFGKYRVVSEVGRGGMGIVYRAEDTALGRMVALKVLPGQLAAEKGAVHRFHREAQVAAALDHPNIVPIFAAGEQDGFHYIAMKLLDGEGLDTIIARDGALPPAKALTILRQIGAALDYARARGVVHRDVKPSNIIVGPNGQATLTDFGIARAVMGDGVTPATMALGTPSYMSPEQLDGKALDGRSDLYSLGVTAYEMLTGRVAFSGTSPMAVVKLRFEQPLPPRPSSVKLDLPAGVDAVLMKAVSPMPSARYASAAEFVADLERATPGAAVRPTPLPKPMPGIPVGGRPKRPLWQWMGGMMALIVLIFASFSAMGSCAPRPAPPTLGATPTGVPPPPVSSATPTPRKEVVVPPVTYAPTATSRPAPSLTPSRTPLPLRQPSLTAEVLPGQNPRAGGAVTVKVCWSDVDSRAEVVQLRGGDISPDKNRVGPSSGCINDVYLSGLTEGTNPATFYLYVTAGGQTATANASVRVLAAKRQCPANPALVELRNQTGSAFTLVLTGPEKVTVQAGLGNTRFCVTAGTYSYVVSSPGFYDKTGTQTFSSVGCDCWTWYKSSAGPPPYGSCNCSTNAADYPAP